MAYKSRYGHQTHVKFVEDSYSSHGESKMEMVASAYNGPHFPNLRKMFRYEGKEETQQRSNHNGHGHEEQPPEKLTNKTSKTVAYEEEDVDLEAIEFIKRKHHSMELEKLMSMKTLNYNA